MKKAFLLVLSLFLVTWHFSGITAFADTVTNVTPGVKLEKRNTTISSKKQAVNILNVNLLDPYTTINYGISSPINQRSTVTALAKANTREKHHVVGAVNASLFHMDSGYPTYLLARNNKIDFLGAVSALSNGFMHTPAAFGIDKAGKGLVSKFNLDITLSHHNKSFKIDSFNRQRDPNESILFTSSNRYDKTRTNQTGLEIVVQKLNKNLDPGASFGDTITGEVTSIRPYGQLTSATIPKDGYVISAHGTQVDQVRDLKIGDPVSLKVDIDDKWKDASFMLASGPLLVQAGKVNMSIDPTSPRATSRTSRTAVAVDKTGTKVFLVTVDKGTAGYSQGMTLKEFSSYLVGLGAYQALNLDGGGSTTLAARMPGNRYAGLINKPSDGTQRRVSAILQAVSTAPYSEAVSFKAAQAEVGKVAVGASVSFKISDALDGYNNLIPYNESQVEYIADNNIGKIENGRFVGLKEGTTNVTVKYGKAQVKVPVTVVATPSQFKVTPGEVYLQKGGEQTLSVTATEADGKPIIMNKNSVSWSVTGNAGTIDDNGKFTAGNAEGKGTIVAQMGSKKVSIPVTVSNKPRLLNGFNSKAEWKAESIRASTTLSSIADGTQYEGNGALRLNYDFTGNKSGTTASYAVASKRIAIPGKPKAIGAWVYGDGKSHWLRGRVYDAQGKEVTIDFTKEAGLNWKGWKYVQAQLPSTVRYPLSFDRIYLAEPTISKQNKGSIVFDQLQAVYDLPHAETYFKTGSDTRTAPANKQWKVEFNIPLSPLSITKENIYVENSKGERMPISVKLSNDLKTVLVNAPSAGYQSGENYRLTVTKYVTSTKGMGLRKDFYMTFKAQ
ncbi:MAG: phosphodiester glycosidase family protein [Cytobacillus gottheilii]